MHLKPWPGDSLLHINLHNIHYHWLPRCHEIAYLSVDLKKIVTVANTQTYDYIELLFKSLFYTWNMDLAVFSSENDLGKPLTFQGQIFLFPRCDNNTCLCLLWREWK